MKTVKTAVSQPSRIVHFAQFLPLIALAILAVLFVKPEYLTNPKFQLSELTTQPVALVLPYNHGQQVKIGGNRPPRDPDFFDINEETAKPNAITMGILEHSPAGIGGSQGPGNSSPGLPATIEVNDDGSICGMLQGQLILHYAPIEIGPSQCTTRDIGGNQKVPAEPKPIVEPESERANWVTYRQQSNSVFASWEACVGLNTVLKI